MFVDSIATDEVVMVVVVKVVEGSRIYTVSVSG